MIPSSSQSQAISQLPPCDGVAASPGSARSEEMVGRALLHSLPPWYAMVQAGSHESPGCTASPGKAVLGNLDAWFLPPRMVHIDDELTPERPPKPGRGHDSGHARASKL